MNTVSSNDEHKARIIDSAEKNKFRFDWLKNVVKVQLGENELELSVESCIEKVEISGKAKCLLCCDLIYYGKRGFNAIRSHLNSKKHVEKERLKRENCGLPSSFYVNANEKKNEKVAPVNIPLCDRVSSLESLMLGVLAEHNLPYTVAPVLVDLSKAMASDRKALSHLSMARTTASYKMRLGMAKTFFDETLNNLKRVKFSLNIDEATSTNHNKVLCMLVSYFSPETNKVVVEHLKSFSVTNMCAKQLFNEIVSLFSENDIPFENLVSILMDSCNVMRGSKSGLEVRIRSEKAPHLLDIDGDSCHHIHNAAKIFCKPFGGWVECYLRDTYNDFNWSVDLKIKLEEICLILGVKFTNVENMVNHRWLSSYDATLANLHMFDCLTIFYYGFLNQSDRLLYCNVCYTIYNQRNVSIESRNRIKDIHKYLQNKNLTTDGRKRKERIISKIFFSSKKTQLIMHFYTSVLPLLKKYVCLFQMKEPLIHKLYSEQKQLFIDFLSLFIKPQFLLGKSTAAILSINLNTTTDECCLLPFKKMYLGAATTDIISKSNGVLVEEFSKNVHAAFMNCATYLQKTLPLENQLLKCVSAIDPIVRGHDITLSRLRKLPQFIKNVSVDRTLYDLEVYKYQVDFKLASPLDSNGKAIRLDIWWAQQVFETGSYPELSKMVKAILSCFHGPQVESAFSSMSNVLDKECGQMTIETLSSIQTVKYKLLSSNKSSLEFFKRNDHLHSPVKATLCKNLRTAHQLYKKELELKREKKEAVMKQIKIADNKEISKKQSLDCVKAAEKKLRLARKRKLEQLAAKVAKKRKLI